MYKPLFQLYFSECPNPPEIGNIAGGNIIDV
jgi:hypothetical protein